MKNKKNKWYRIIRIMLRIFAVIIALLFTLIISLNIPAVQTFIVAKITESIHKKTGAEISIGSVKIAFPKTVDISDVYFQDQNTDTLLYINSLYVNIDLFGLLSNKVIVKSLDLEGLVANIHRKNADQTFNFQFIIDAVSADTTDNSDTTKPEPWIIVVRDINLKNIRAAFSDSRAGIDASVDLGDFEITVDDFDITKQFLSFNDILLKNTTVHLTLTKPDIDKTAPFKTTDAISNKSDNSAGPGTSGYFSDWSILADQLTIENTNIRFDNASFPKLTGAFDYNHLHVSNLNTGIRGISIDSDGYKADIRNMSFTESCGFELNKFTADAQFTGRQMEVKNLQIETATSKISADASLAYASFIDLSKDFGNCMLKLDLRSTVVNPDEVFWFAPALAADKIAGKFKDSDVFISVKAEGRMNDLVIENLEVSLLKETSLKSHARLTGLPDLTNLAFDAAINLISTSLEDVYQFIDPAFAAGLKLPETFDLKGTVSGKPDSLYADIQLISAFGTIAADAFYQNHGSAVRDTFNVDFAADNILAGVILGDTLLGEISFSGKAAGSGMAVGPVSGEVSLEINYAQYNSYTYKNILVNSEVDGNIFSVTASSEDPNLDFELIATADLSGEKKKYSARLNLSMLDLHALNFTQENIAIITNLTADLDYIGFDNLDANLGMTNTKLIANQKAIPVNMMNLKAFSAPDSLKVQIRSDIADGTISGNINPEKLTKNLQTAYRKYFGLADTSQVQPGKRIAFSLDVHIPQDIIDQFMPELDLLEISKLKGSYNSDNNVLSLEIQVPEAIYSNVHLDSLSMDVSGKDESLSLEIICGKISYDSLQFEKLLIREQVDKGAILSEIKISDSLGKPRYLFANAIELKDNFLGIHFLPKGLILDGITYNVDKDNFIIKNDSMKIEFSLENEENKISLNGDVAHLSGTPALNMDVLVGINNLGRLEQYSFGALSELSGKIDGEFSLKGTTEKPEIEGFLEFYETAFKMNSLDFLARINGQKINFNKQGIHFNDFMIEDEQAKKLTINGDIQTGNYKDFNLDLSLAGKNFQPINSTSADNPLFFGKLSLDTDIKLKGDLKSPKIEADIKINSITNLTYALPGSELKLVSSEGVVYFLKPSETHDSLIAQRQSKSLTDSIISRLTGINLSMKLEIDPDAKFTLDIDPKSGDYLTVGGSAKLDISLDETGKQSINGVYEVKSGFYQLSFYDLVKKSFTIMPGSTISWSGRPMDADLDITAEYTVTTPSVGLMASETATMSDSEKAMFQQRLPYEVRLNIRGQLAEPDISFAITLPEKYLTSNQLIAAKLAQLNTEEMAPALNKQVFALLVTGTFIADNSSSGDSPTSVASTAARNSVNGILADQMNKVSGKYIKQVDVNFGLTTFDDGTNGSSDTRTELDMQVSKKLFNDRVTVEAQGSVNLEGNKNSANSSSAHNSDEFAITYDMTKSGEYKLRAYYQTGYDLFDGDITYSGVAVIFEREYDSLKRQKKPDDGTKKRKKHGAVKGEGLKNEGPELDYKPK